MNKEFFEALAMLEKEKGIPMQYLIEKIEAAISIAIKRDENGAEDNVVEINPETGRFYVAVRKTVVEEIEDPANEILKAEAAKYNKTAAVGDIIEIPLETKDFGRIAAQAAKHVIRQGIREARMILSFLETVMSHSCARSRWMQAVWSSAREPIFPRRSRRWQRREIS